MTMPSSSPSSSSSGSESSEEDLLFEQILRDDEISDTAVHAILADCDESSSEGTGEWGGSKPGKVPNKPRDFIGACERLINHCFSGPASLHDENDFERRFRCPRAAFQKLCDKILGKGTFAQHQDATKKRGINPLVRLTACMRKLACGDASDREDEVLQISETVVNDCFKEFTRHVETEFGDQCLNRTPAEEEKKRCLHVNATRGFPGMRSLACLEAESSNEKFMCSDIDETNGVFASRSIHDLHKWK